MDNPNSHFPSKIVLIEHYGSISSNQVLIMQNEFEHSLLVFNPALLTYKRAILVFNELLSNLQKYADAVKSANTSFAVSVDLTKNELVIQSKNEIEICKIPDLINKLNCLSNQNAEQLKSIYLNAMQKSDERIQGAGLGLIDIFRKSSSVEFGFKNLKSDSKLFVIIATITL